MDLDSLDALETKLAEAILDFRGHVRRVAEDLSDADLDALIEHCRSLAGVTESRNFKMPQWAEVADLLLTEKGIRIIFRKAETHFKATGEGAYCVACDGTCREDHLNGD